MARDRRHPGAPAACSALELKLTLHERNSLEVKGNVVLSGEDINRAAGLREKVQVQF